MVDSEPVWDQVFTDYFLSNYGYTLPEEILWANTGSGVPTSVKNCAVSGNINLTSEEILEIANTITHESHRRILEDVPLREGALDVMKWSYSQNIKMGICSASPQAGLENFVKNNDLTDFISVIVSVYDYPYKQHKPSPVPYQNTLKELGERSDQAIAVEDSPSGVQSALNAELYTVAMKSYAENVRQKVNTLNPTLQVSNFDELLQHLVEGTL